MMNYEIPRVINISDTNQEAKLSYSQNLIPDIYQLFL